MAARINLKKAYDKACDDLANASFEKFGVVKDTADVYDVASKFILPVMKTRAEWLAATSGHLMLFLPEFCRASLRRVNRLIAGGVKYHNPMSVYKEDTEYDGVIRLIGRLRPNKDKAGKDTAADGWFPSFCRMVMGETLDACPDIREGVWMECDTWDSYATYWNNFFDKKTIEEIAVDAACGFLYGPLCPWDDLKAGQGLDLKGLLADKLTRLAKKEKTPSLLLDVWKALTVVSGFSPLCYQRLMESNAFPLSFPIPSVVKKFEKNDGKSDPYYNMADENWSLVVQTFFSSHREMNTFLGGYKKISVRFIGISEARALVGIHSQEVAVRGPASDAIYNAFPDRFQSGPVPMLYFIPFNTASIIDTESTAISHWTLCVVHRDKDSNYTFAYLDSLDKTTDLTSKAVAPFFLDLVTKLRGNPDEIKRYKTPPGQPSPRRMHCGLFVATAMKMCIDAFLDGKNLGDVAAFSAKENLTQVEEFSLAASTQITKVLKTIGETWPTLGYSTLKRGHQLYLDTMEPTASTPFQWFKKFADLCSVVNDQKEEAEALLEKWVPLIRPLFAAKEWESFFDEWEILLFNNTASFLAHFFAFVTLIGLSDNGSVEYVKGKMGDIMECLTVDNVKLISNDVKNDIEFLDAFGLLKSKDDTVDNVVGRAAVCLLILSYEDTVVGNNFPFDFFKNLFDACIARLAYLTLHLYLVDKDTPTEMWLGVEKDEPYAVDLLLSLLSSWKDDTKDTPSNVKALKSYIGFAKFDKTKLVQDLIDASTLGLELLKRRNNSDTATVDDIQNLKSYRAWTKFLAEINLTNGKLLKADEYKLVSAWIQVDPNTITSALMYTQLLGSESLTQRFDELPDEYKKLDTCFPIGEDYVEALKKSPSALFTCYAWANAFIDDVKRHEGILKRDATLISVINKTKKRISTFEGQMAQWINEIKPSVQSMDVKFSTKEFLSIVLKSLTCLQRVFAATTFLSTTVLKIPPEGEQDTWVDAMAAFFQADTGIWRELNVDEKVRLQQIGKIEYKPSNHGGHIYIIPDEVVQWYETWTNTIPKHLVEQKKLFKETTPEFEKGRSETVMTAIDEKCGKKSGHFLFTRVAFDAYVETIDFPDYITTQKEVDNMLSLSTLDADDYLRDIYNTYYEDKGSWKTWPLDRNLRLSTSLIEVMSNLLLRINTWHASMAKIGERLALPGSAKKPLTVELLLAVPEVKAALVEHKLDKSVLNLVATDITKLKLKDALTRIVVEVMRTCILRFEHKAGDITELLTRINTYCTTWNKSMHIFLTSAYEESGMFNLEKFLADIVNADKALLIYTTLTYLPSNESVKWFVPPGLDKNAWLKNVAELAHLIKSNLEKIEDVDGIDFTKPLTFLKNELEKKDAVKFIRIGSESYLKLAELATLWTEQTGIETKWKTILKATYPLRDKLKRDTKDLADLLVTKLKFEKTDVIEQNVLRWRNVCKAVDVNLFYDEASKYSKDETLPIAPGFIASLRTLRDMTLPTPYSSPPSIRIIIGTDYNKIEDIVNPLNKFLQAYDAIITWSHIKNAMAAADAAAAAADAAAPATGPVVRVTLVIPSVPVLPMPDPHAIIVAPCDELHRTLMAQVPHRSYPAKYDDPEWRLDPARNYREQLVAATRFNAKVREAEHLANVERRVAAEWMERRREYARKERAESGLDRPRRRW